MTVTVKHSKTNAISDWTQAQLDEQIELGNFAPGTTLADIVLPSDWNNDHTLTGVGTMAEQDANTVAITGGTINGTTIGATTASTGKFTSVTTPSVTATTNDLTLSAISTGAVKFNTLGGLQAQVTDQTSADLVWTIKGGSSSLAARATLGTNSGAPNFYATGNTIIFTTNGANNADAFRISHTASAVNYVQVTGGATGSFPVMSAQGSDGTVGLNLYAKGAARINFFNNNGSNRHVSIGGNGTAAVNFIDLNGTTATNAPTFSVAGSDTNISMAFQPKGTGAIDLAAGSRGVNISNGGTVTAITRTATGSGYTSAPTATISAPTTAGGVTATVTPNMFLATYSIANGGTGYTVGNVLTVVGGTQSSPIQFTVSSVSSGVITAVTITSFGFYSALPTSPVSVTGGTGSSATFNLLTWGVSGFTITNAGSGYIEQPTVTISGGGGSGASAYATVGSNTTIKNLGNITTFATPNSNVLAIVDKNSAGNNPTNTTVAFAMVPSQSAFGASFLGFGSQAYLGTTNTSSSAFVFATSVSSPVSNGGGGSAQLNIAHTASAVNYVQVTGSATTGSVVISSQGSDTNVGLQLRSKGTGDINLMTAGGTNQVVVRNVASAVNYLSLKGSAAGNMVPIQVEGTDTNIDLALTPKGTGLVRFGTYTAGALTATGYINIKAADGTTYKVLVST